MTDALFRDRCRCQWGVLPGGAPCPDYPRCAIEDIIARHAGRAQAISIDRIAAMIWPRDPNPRRREREIKLAVHELRMEGVRIGSTRFAAAEGGGYFMIESLAELRDFLRGYMRQALTELRLIERMLGKDYRIVKELEGQLSLDLELDEKVVA